MQNLRLIFMSLNGLQIKAITRSAFDECEFTHAEVSAAHAHIELLAAQLLKEAHTLDQGTPPSVIQKPKPGNKKVAKPD